LSEPREFRYVKRGYHVQASIQTLTDRGYVFNVPDSSKIIVGLGLVVERAIGLGDLLCIMAIITNMSPFLAKKAGLDRYRACGYGKTS
jgi:hypothetical protein